MSGAKWASLDDRQKGWVLEAASRAGAEGRAAYDRELEDAIAQAKKKGMEFIAVDKSGFIKSTEAMVGEKEGTVWPKGLVERIKAIK
jgi:TRAP-type C4-dicarboxylate transport system substrate-binding protein